MYYNWKNKVNEEELKIVCNLIKKGEIVIFPTETVYGIGANALDEKSVEKIFIAKGRPSDNPLIVHLADKSEINNIAKDITEVEQKLIDNFMPGPFTIILKKKNVISNVVSAGLDTVGIRVPNNIIAKKIITFSGVPIAAPSANISGRPSGTNIEDIKKELGEKVSAIIDGGETEVGIESTVVKVENEIPIILRPGKVTPEDIKKVIGKVKIDDKVFEKVQENSEIESPGMKYKHYAPNTKCKLIYCEDESEQIFYMNNIIEEYKRDVVILGFTEHEEKINISKERYIALGSKDNLEEVAKNIYTKLRQADKFRAQIILIEGMKKEGIGIALVNRLLRTCEYNYFERVKIKGDNL